MIRLMLQIIVWFAIGAIASTSWTNAGAVSAGLLLGYAIHWSVSVNRRGEDQ